MKPRGSSTRGKPEGQEPASAGVINLLPGPVKIHPSVHQAFVQAPVSHRAPRFVQDFHRTRERLCALVHSSRVAVLLGSGTLANDAVAGQLSLTGEPGLILCNGEFGDRLVEQARRFGLPFDILSAEWGQALSYDDLRRTLRQVRRIRWLWAVHCETSTGVLNDIAVLKRLAREFDACLCLDCISSIGTVPVDLRGVFLATGVSGKGLAAYPGLSFVFHHHPVPPSPALPRYLDLGGYASTQGLPFTHSSNLVYALDRSLTRFSAGNGTPASHPADIFEATALLGRWLRQRLEALGFTILAPEPIASPAVVTLALPRRLDSVRMGEYLERHGVLLSYRSQYLVRRNFIQICLMGEHGREEVTLLLDRLRAFRSLDGRPRGRKRPVSIRPPAL